MRLVEISFVLTFCQDLINGQAIQNKYRRVPGAASLACELLVIRSLFETSSLSNSGHIAYQTKSLLFRPKDMLEDMG